MPQPSARIENLPVYVFAEIGEKIRNLEAEGADVVRLDIGNPDMPPDDSIINALHEHASSPSNHGYSGYRGIASFRESVARFYKHRFDVELDAETEVLPLIGTKEGIINLTMAYISDGDVALIPDIGYPSYAMGTRLAGGTVKYISTNAENFLLDVSRIPSTILDQAKLMWVNYPNNPTGATATQQFYSELLDICRKHDILLASDNPYVDITYDGYKASSFLQLPDSKDYAVEFFSLSKTYNMAGWRIGAVVGNSEALKHLLKVKSNVDGGHFKAIYEAGSIALDTISDEWIEKRNSIYQSRRDLLYEALPNIGLSAQLPKASLYLWAKIPSRFENDDITFVNQILEDIRVSMSPGSAYGPAGKGYVRLSLSTPNSRIQEAINRLTKWYSELDT
jgi:LL-diaminopimelate aminotransferase